MKQNRLPAPLFRCLLLAAALVYLAACSRGDVMRAAKIAATGDMAAAQQAAAEKAAGYAADPGALKRDIHRFESLLEAFRRLIGGTWGEDEVREPAPKRS